MKTTAWSAVRSEMYECNVAIVAGMRENGKGSDAIALEFERAVLVAEGLHARLGRHALRVRVQRRVLVLEHRPRVRAVCGRHVPEVEQREIRPREL